ncbi:general transcription factor II-I repeat domain-containing protein 2-like [Halictus rubicundus]|uniref:general transcription factor II-I repeat domain-containing protein 2-like n=1 Tax=Halictus rubicundus TaxID=77578 RepID=UPI004036AFE2
MEKIVGVSTDGARAMSSMNVGLSVLLSKDIKNLTGREILISYCILHQENLGAKVLKMSNVVPAIIKIDMECEYGDILFNTEVRWLSRGMKDNPFSQFDDKGRMCDFVFCVDITQHLNELNIKLQGKNKLVTEMFDKIKAFEQKLKIWNQQLESNKTVNFAILRKENPSETKKYAMETQILQKELTTKFPLLATRARQMMSLLGGTYTCQQLFSKIIIIKSDRRNRLDDERLNNCNRVAVSSIAPNIDKLVNEKRSQVSH